MNETADNFPSKYKEDDNTSKLKITVPEPFQF